MAYWADKNMGLGYISVCLVTVKQDTYPVENMTVG